MIYYNHALPDLSGFSQLQAVGDDLILFQNAQLVSLHGLGGLASIGGSLIFEQNGQLTDLQGLDQLTSIGSDLILQKTCLNSLNGLQSLNEIAGSLKLTENLFLSDLSPLEHPVYIGADLLITGNPLLSECAVQAVCDYLLSPAGSITIEDNAPGCATVEEVETACTVGSTEPGHSWQTIGLSPNPTDGRLDIAGLEGLEGLLHVHDGSGRILLEQSFAGPATIDLGTIAPGLYYLSIRTSKQTICRKFIRE